MNEKFQLTRLQELNADFTQIKGQPFSHFFCPVLYRDDDVALCKAHIVNQAFPEAPLDWTVQRKDVDNFYGSTFESEFVAVQYNAQTRDDIFADKKLSNLFKPQILVDNKPVDYFVADSEIPKDFTRLQFDNNGQIIQLALKMSPEVFDAAKENNWEMAISKDVRVPALVSLIKAAHLTLFEMLGYRYALSAGGHFVGRHILGEFFLQNYGKPRPDALKNAYPFFREFANMVRPVNSSEINFQGTITDKQLLLCQEYGGTAWAIVVFVKAAQSLHAVLLPFFDQPDAVAKYFKFLQYENETVEVVLMQFEKEQFKLIRPTKLIWPKNGILYPD